MDNRMYDKYVSDPFERAELHMNPMMYEKIKNRYSGVAAATAYSRNHEYGVRSSFPASTPLAMAYIPFQQWEEPYSCEKALSAGTVFASLEMPFLAYGGNCCD